MVAPKNDVKPTVEELLAKAKKPAQLSPAMHRFYEGKMHAAWTILLSGTLQA